MTGTNLYNTNDPEVLLQLKRQEAEAMLHIVRSVHPASNPHELIYVVISTIRNQLSVNKLILVLNEFSQNKLKVNHQFPDCSKTEWSFLSHYHTPTRVEEGSHPILMDLAVEYVIPLGSMEEPSGWFLIADFAESESETQNDLIFIETVGNILVISLEHIYLFDKKVREELLQQELEVAGSIQKQLLPSEFNLFSQLDIYALNIAHYKVAGDFYDLIPLNEDELVFCIGDVAGKGIPAAILVANIQANIRALVPNASSLASVAHQLHAAISRLKNAEQYVTLFIGRLNVKTHKLVYVNAGHNPPFLHRAGMVKELNKGCIPLGILPLTMGVEVGYERLYPGDTLFLYTDGVIEEVNHHGEQLGTEPVKQFLKGAGDKTAKRIIEDSLDMIWRHARNYAVSDDLSIMILRALG